MPYFNMWYLVSQNDQVCMKDEATEILAKEMKSVEQSWNKVCSAMSLLVL